MRQSQRLRDKHAELLAEFRIISDAQWQIRQGCLQARRFASIAGAQWEGDLDAQWATNKPRFEVNVIQRSINRIYSEYQNQRLDAQFISKDGKNADEIADVCASRYRSDMQDSCAEEAKSNAFSESTAGGMGAYRLQTVLEDEDNDDGDDYEDKPQRIAFSPIVDADTSVYFDIDAKRQDKSDARLCFIITALARQSYIATHGDDIASFPKSLGETYFDWCTPDIVYVAEVYEVERKREKLHVFQNLALAALGEDELGDTETEREYTDKDLEDEELVAELQATGWQEVRIEKPKRKRVHKYVMSGGRILEDCGYIAGPNIPVVVTYGKRWFIDNLERFQGQAQLGMDSQRLKNMQTSKLAEIAAYSTIEKPIFAPQQVTGVLSDYWALDSVKNYAYMLANPLYNPDGSIAHIGPTGYTKVPQIPPALVALLQLTDGDLQTILGEKDSAEEVHSNVSGKAVELTQTRIDMQAYIYIDNMAKAEKRCGEIWYGMAKEVYVQEGRLLKGIDRKGSAQSLKLMEPTMIDGVQGYKNNIRDSKLDIAITVGPSSQSKRDATVRSLTGLLGVVQNPQDLEILTSMILQNIEAEGIEDVNKYYHRKLVRMGVERATPEEEKELQAEKQAADQQAQNDPQAQYLRAGAQKEMALANKALADAMAARAKAEESQASAAKSVSDIKVGELGAQLQILDAVNAALEPQQPIEPQQPAAQIQPMETQGAMV